MLHLYKHVMLLLIGVLLIMTGLFIAVAGTASGFGHHNFFLRAGFLYGGTVATGVGVYLYNVGTNRILTKIFATSITVIGRILKQ